MKKTTRGRMLAILLSAGLVMGHADWNIYALTESAVEDELDSLSQDSGEHIPAFVEDLPENVLQENVSARTEETDVLADVIQDSSGSDISGADGILLEDADNAVYEISEETEPENRDSQYDAFIIEDPDEEDLPVDYDASEPGLIAADDTILEQEMIAADGLTIPTAIKKGTVVASGKMFQGVSVRYTWELDDNGTLWVKYYGSLNINKLQDQSAYGEPVTDYTDLLADQVKTVVYDGLSETQTIYNLHDNLVLPNAHTLIVGKNVTGNYSYSGEDEQGNRLTPAYVNIEIQGNLNSVYCKEYEHLRSIRVTGSVNSVSAQDSTSLEEVYIACYTGNSIGSQAFQGDTALINYVVENATQDKIDIGTWAFQNCSALKMISLPVSFGSIEQMAFENCESLSILPAVLDQVSFIGLKAFHNCVSLKEIHISSTVSEVSTGAFQDCNTLETVSISKISDFSVSCLFKGCSSLKKLEVGACDGTVKLEGGNFWGCSALTDISIPELAKISSVDFCGCSSLKSIPDLSHLESVSLNDYVNGIHISDGEGLFAGCASLMEVVFPDNLEMVFPSFDGYYHGYKGMFDGCSALQRVHLPMNIGQGIPQNMFRGCSSLMTLENLTQQENLVYVGDTAFSGCDMLKELELPDTITTLYSVSPGVEHFRIPASASSFENGTFKGCVNLKELTIPSSAPSIDSSAVSGYEGFYLTSLEKIIYEDHTADNSKYLGGFPLSVIPENMEIQLVLPSGLTTFPSALREATCFSEITIPEGTTSLENYCFYKCTNLKKIVLPESLTRIGEYAFAEDTILEEINLPSSLSTIGRYAFQNCSNLKRITLPGSLSEITNSFDGSGLETAILEEGITSLSSSAFSNVSSLYDITLPSSLREIGAFAFSNTSVTSLLLDQQELTVHRNGLLSGFDYLAFTGNSLTLESSAIYGSEHAKLVFDCDNISMVSGSISFRSSSDDSAVSLYFLNGEVDFGNKGISATIENMTVSVMISPQVTKIEGTLPPVRNGKMLIYGEPGSAAEQLAQRSQAAASSQNAATIEFIPVENGAVTHWESEADGFVYTVNDGEAYITNCLKRESTITVPSYLGEEVGNFPVVGILPGAFANRISMEKVILPETIRELPRDFAWHTGWGCKLLDKIEISEDNPYLSAENGIVYNKDKTKLLFALPGITEAYILESVTEICEYAFELCQVRSLTVPDSVSIFGEGALTGSFQTVILGAGIGSSIPEALFENSYVSTVMWPDTVVTIENSAFKNCRFLKNIGCMENVTCIGDSAFEGCRNLESVGQLSALIDIGERAFYECKSLQSFVFPVGLVHIGREAFAECEALETVDLPDSVVKIGDSAFASSGLRTLTCASEELDLTDPDERPLYSIHASVYAQTGSALYEYIRDTENHIDPYLKQEAGSGVKIGHYLLGIKVKDDKRAYLTRCVQDWFELQFTREVECSGSLRLLNVEDNQSLYEVDYGSVNTKSLHLKYKEDTKILPDKEVCIELPAGFFTEDGEMSESWSSQNYWTRLSMTDCWLEPNPSGESISRVDFYNVLGLIRGQMEYWADHGQDGICFGFALSYLMAKAGLIDPTTFGKPGMYETHANDYSNELQMTALKLWQIAFVGQKKPSVSKQIKQHKHDHIGLLNATRSMLFEQGTPVIYRFSLILKGATVIHAIVPVSMEESDNGSVTIYCYDSITPDHLRRLFYNSHQDKFYYESNENNPSETNYIWDVSYVYVDDSLTGLLDEYTVAGEDWQLLKIGVDNLENGVDNLENTAEYTIQFVDSANKRLYEVSDAKGTENIASNSDESEDPGDFAHLLTDYEGKNISLYWYEANNEPLTLEKIPKGTILTMGGTKGLAHVKVQTLSDVTLYAADSEKGSSVSVVPRVSDGYDVTIQSQFDEASKQAGREIHLTGQTKGTITIREDESGVWVNGADNVTVEMNENGETASQSWEGLADSKLSDSSLHLELIKDENGVAVLTAKTDQDEDGIPDTLVEPGKQEPEGNGNQGENGENGGDGGSGQNPNENQDPQNNHTSENQNKKPIVTPTKPVEKITVTKKPSIKKLSATKNKITVNWKHFKHTSKKTKSIWKKIKKVQIQCATDNKFKNIVNAIFVGKKKTKGTVKGLAKKKTYYVRIRYYDGTGYSAWSKVKKVKTKK